jgi:hypothetical protein
MTVHVGRTDGKAIEVRNLADAEQIITIVSLLDPTGVEAGNYYIDAPDEPDDRPTTPLEREHERGFDTGYSAAIHDARQPGSTAYHKLIDGVVQAVQAESEKNRHDFLLGMLRSVAGAGQVDELPLAELEDIYTEHYDEIWLASDNDDHERDDSHEGYQEGLKFVLQTMVEHGFNLKLLTPCPVCGSTEPDCREGCAAARGEA